VTPGLRTIEEGGATEATPAGVGGKILAESKKCPTTALMAETKVIGRAIAPSSRRRKKNWTETRTPNHHRSQSTIPTTTSREARHHKFSGSHRNNLTGLRHILPCHHPSQPSTTTPHTPHQPFQHLRCHNSRKSKPLRHHIKGGTHNPSHKPTYLHRQS
jgi:hypothetical protein